MLNLKNITYKKNRKTILDDINLNIKKGKFYVITGPNGAGKSFLSKVIMGIEKPTSGEIIFKNQNITKMPLNERANFGISFAFQSPIKFKGITVYDMLKLASGKEIDINVACAILGEVGLCAKEYLTRDVDGSLSGGELKRIEIATVLSREGEIFIFDEPEAGIDIWSFNKLIDVFKNMQQKNKDRTIIVVSHQERILNIADEIILIENGKIKKQGERAEMLKLLGVSMTKSCNCPGGSCNE